MKQNMNKIFITRSLRQRRTDIMSEVTRNTCCRMVHSLLNHFSFV